MKSIDTAKCIVISAGNTVSLQAGQVRISTEAATLEHLAQQFWHRILAMADMNDDQQLSLDEFQTLMKVCCMLLADQ